MNHLCIQRSELLAGSLMATLGSKFLIMMTRKLRICCVHFMNDIFAQVFHMSFSKLLMSIFRTCLFWLSWHHFSFAIYRHMLFVLWVHLLKTVNCWKFYVVLGSIVVADAQLPDQGISINKSGSSLLFQSMFVNMVTFNLNTFWIDNPFKKNLLSH